MPPARRNQERRARRAARTRAQRDERRRRELERRRQQRERDEARDEAVVEEPPAPAPSPQAEPVQERPAEPPVAQEPEPSWAVADPAAAAWSTRRPDTPAAGRSAATRGRAARRRVTVRRVDPWSVFRLSLVLYFCLLVVVTLGLVIFWLVLSRLPVLQQTIEVIEQLGIPFDPTLVLTILVPVGLLNVLLWSLANLFFAVLYNLVADLVGGLRMTLGEEVQG